ncbi:MAG: hypothetical protein HOM84_07545 [Thiotrichales bacterium]|jgi:hypothetical protein|nr:hypothetical protein [Thiotrichales bacterium]MBT4261087.1 hypothetical protein [Thiotrichales bacterium]MBT4972383.1 hypothetical protein [Thiotrichales bacterium]
METVTLKINDDVKEKFLWLLNHFSQSEIEMLEKTTYQSDDAYLKSIKGMEESIVEAANEPLENYITEDKLSW